MNETLLKICGIDKFFKKYENWSTRYIDVSINDKVVKEPVKKKSLKKASIGNYSYEISSPPRFRGYAGGIDTALESPILPPVQGLENGWVNHMVNPRSIVNSFTGNENIIDANANIIVNNRPIPTAGSISADDIISDPFEEADNINLRGLEEQIQEIPILAEPDRINGYTTFTSAAIREAFEGIYDSRVEYKAFHNSFNDVKSETKSNVVLCLYNNSKSIYKDNMSYAFKLIKNERYIPSSTISTEKIISELCYAKLKNYTESGSIFGWTPTKKEMFESGALFNINKIKLDYESPKTGTIINYIELAVPNGKNLKFLLDEVEIITPDIEKLTKGYNEPIKRTKEERAHIKVVKKHNLPYGTKAVIINSFKQGNSRYCKIMTSDKKLHLIESKKIKVIA